MMEMKTYEVDDKEVQRLIDCFSYHVSKEGQVDKYDRIRKDILEFAGKISVLCPPSRERSLALTKLQEAMMWANASIAINE